MATYTPHVEYFHLSSDSESPLPPAPRLIRRIFRRQATRPQAIPIDLTGPIVISSDSDIEPPRPPSPEVTVGRPLVIPQIGYPL